MRQILFWLNTEPDHTPAQKISSAPDITQFAIRHILEQLFALGLGERKEESLEYSTSSVLLRLQPSTSSEPVPLLLLQPWLLAPLHRCGRCPAAVPAVPAPLRRCGGCPAAVPAAGGRGLPSRAHRPGRAGHRRGGGGSWENPVPSISGPLNPRCPELPATRPTPAAAPRQ